MTENLQSAPAAPAAEPTAGDTNVLALGEDALDKALGDVLGGEDDDGPPAPRQPKGAKARAKVEDDDDEVEPSEEEGDAEPDEDDDDETGEDLNDSAADEDEEDEPEGDEEAALEHAYEVLLKRKAAPFSVLKRTPKATLIAWANRVEAEEAEVSASSPAPKRDDGEAPDTKAQGGKSPAKPGDAETRWAAIRSNAATALGVDEEAVDGAFKPLHDANESLREEVAAMRAERARDRDESLAREARVTIDGELKRLEKLGHQGLRADADKVEKLIEHATALIRGKVVKTAAEAFTAAAKALLPRPKRADLAQHRRNGFSEPPTRRSDRASTATTEDEWFAENLDHAYAGRRHLIGRTPMPSRTRSK